MISMEIITPTPTHISPEPSNALEKDLTASQHRILAADILMDWLDNQNMSLDHAADLFGLSRNTMILVINKSLIHSVAALKLANKIPELIPHLEGIYNA